MIEIAFSTIYRSKEDMTKVIEESRSAAQKQEDEDLEKAKERSLEEMTTQTYDVSSMQVVPYSYQASQTIF